MGVCGGIAIKGSQKIDGGFAALRATRPFPLAAGPLQSTVIKELRGQEAAISFPSNPFRKRAFVGAARKRN